MKLFIVILALTPSLVFSQAIGRDGKKINCEDTSNYEQSDFCLEFAFEKSDKKLNEVWKKVLKKFDDQKTSYEIDKTPEGVLRHKEEIERFKQWKADLIKSQKNWVAFKIADCHHVVAHEYHGGSAKPAMMAACEKSLTDARIDDLVERYLTR